MTRGDGAARGPVRGTGGRRDERGTTVVEFAFVSLVLFGLFFGLVGISLVEIGDSVGANAAREGARTASMTFLCADAQSPGGAPVAGCSSIPAPTDAYPAIVAQVKARLVGLVKGTPVVKVQCLDGSTATLTAKPCDQAVVPQSDLVKVTVEWSPISSTPFVGSGTRTSSATVTVVSAAPSDPAAEACEVTSSGFGGGASNPDQVTIVGGGSSGRLLQSVTVTANTTDTCPSLYVAYRDSAGLVTSAAMPMTGAAPSFTVVLDPTLIWTPDTFTFVFTDASGAAYPSVAPTLRLVVSTASVCSLVSATVAPTAVPLVSGAISQGGLAVPVVVTVSTAGSCTGVTVGFNTGVTFVTNLAMLQVATTFSVTIPAASYLWTTGLKVLTFTTAAGTTIGSATLSVTAGCALRLEVDGALGLPILGVKLTGKKTGILSSPITIKATPVGSGCSGPLTFDFNTGVTHVLTSVNLVAGTYQLPIAVGTYTWAVGTVAFAFTYASNPIAPNPTQRLVTCKSNAVTCP